MEKVYKLFYRFFVELKGWQEFKNSIMEVRNELVCGNAPLLKNFPDIFKLVYLYITPIEKETKVIEGIIIDDDGENYLMISEDGRIYTDTLDCVAGKDRDEVQRILDDIRTDMERSGEFD